MIFDINNIDRITLFWYVVLFLGTIFVFSNINIKLNVVYGTLLVIILLVVLNQNYVKKQETTNNLLQIKNNSILPHSETITHYKELINFIFSIQEFYTYNPQAYETMIESLDTFFKYYEEILNNNNLAGTHYNVMLDKYKLVLNSLQSIIFNIDSNDNNVEKLNLSVEILSFILENYLNIVKNTNETNIYNYGHNIHTKLIPDTNIVPYNTYQHDDIGTFDIY